MDHYHIDQQETGQVAASSATGHPLPSGEQIIQQQHQPPVGCNLDQKQADNNTQLEDVAVEREILNYPTFVMEQQLAQQQHQQGSHVENYEHHHQHEHDAFYSAENNAVTGQEQAFYATENNASANQKQASQTEQMEIDGSSYDNYSSVYETAIEAARPAYNLLPYAHADNSVTHDQGVGMTNLAQNNDAVNQLIGEYFAPNSEGRDGQLSVNMGGDEHIAHDHAHEHAHTEHTVADAPADLSGMNQPSQDQMNEFNYVQQHHTQIAQELPQQPIQFQQQQDETVRVIQHPATPPQVSFAQTAANSLISEATRDNAESIIARGSMNDVLKEQREANEAFKRAEEELQRAKAQLEEAKLHKIITDERVNMAADSLTDGLLKEQNRWNAMYEKLVKFKEREGHCDVSRNPFRSSTKRVQRDKESLEQNELIALGAWVGQNRLEARRPPDHPDRIEPYKVIALNRLGFDWQPRENYWMDMYEQLKLYLIQNNGKMPPRMINSQKNPLGQWCDTQLENYRQFNRGSKKAYITQEKIDLLNEIGFVWDKHGKLCIENYEKLKLFKQKHGHCKATQSVNGGDRPLSLWVAKQRRKYNNFKIGMKKEILTERQVALLDELDFSNTYVDTSAAASKVVDAVITQF